MTAATHNSSGGPEIRRSGNASVVLSLSGPVDSDVAQALLATVEEEASQCPRMVVDVGEVSEIGSAGLGALVRALKVARDAGGDLVLARPTPELCQLLDETGLERVLRSFDDPAAAQAAVSGGTA